MVADAASRTAVLVCQGRAVAHGRLARGRFDDPIAAQLLRDDELQRVHAARAASPPRGLRARMDYELLGRQAESMAARTVAIDDAVRRAANPQLVILGAGLDGRAWRMSDLARVAVFEVDHPASQAAKASRAASLAQVAGSVAFVPADLVDDDLSAALASAGHDESQPTTWILEGVIPYLTEPDAQRTVAAVAARSAPTSTLVVSYQTPSMQGGLARLTARLAFMVMGRGDPMAKEPRRSSWTPESVSALVSDRGFAVSEDIALVDLARELSVPARQVASSRVAVAVVPGSA